MRQRYYQTGQLATIAAVSERTLRYYDKVGLLSPTHYSEAGYRLYTDEDLKALQHILALKFLGFSLDEIKAYLKAGPQQLQEALYQQKMMLQDKQVQIERIINAIERLEDQISQGQWNWHALTSIIQEMQMEQKKEWVNKYFSPEQQKTMSELSEQAYSSEAKVKLERRPVWTEDDQKKVDAEYAHVASELKRLVASGANPADPDAQAVAQQFTKLIQGFTMGDPEIMAGLKKWHQLHQELPAERQVNLLPWNDEENAFLQQACIILQQK